MISFPPPGRHGELEEAAPGLGLDFERGTGLRFDLLLV